MEGFQKKTIVGTDLVPTSSDDFTFISRWIVDLKCFKRMWLQTGKVTKAF